MNLLTAHDFEIEAQEVVDCIDEYKIILPPNIIELLKNKEAIDPTNESFIPWLRYLKIEYYYNYIYHRGKNPGYTPLYYKWCQDAIWIAEHEDVKNVVNIFLFNGEELQSIERIIKFKYSKKISQNALKIYSEIFWDCTGLSSKEAVYRYKPFQDTMLIVRKLEDGPITDIAEIEKIKDINGDVSGNILERDIQWIKWKVGIKDIDIPTPQDFLNKVKLDSTMLYDEVMRTRNVKEIKVVENKIKITKDDEGNIESELYDEKELSYKDLLEYKLSNAKKCTDLYIKAHSHMPKEGSNSTKKFFERMEEIEMRYDSQFDPNSKIVSIEDNQGALDDYLKAVGGGEEGEV